MQLGMRRERRITGIFVAACYVSRIHVVHKKTVWKVCVYFNHFWLSAVEYVDAQYPHERFAERRFNELSLIAMNGEKLAQLHIACVCIGKLNCRANNEANLGCNVLILLFAYQKWLKRNRDAHGAPRERVRMLGQMAPKCPGYFLRL